ncbi:bifunctional glutamine-synthetase adenylyltransferase/deadenyltransferase [compost metagenome]
MKADAALLADAYRNYRKRIHALTLQEVPAVVSEDELHEVRQAVMALWRQQVGENA